MQVSTRATSSFEFEGCNLIHRALPLASFRIPKSKPTKRILLKNLVEADIENEAMLVEAGSPLPAPALSLEAVQLCFAKAKMLSTEEDEDNGKTDERRPNLSKISH